MEIQYLQALRDYPHDEPFSCRGITEVEIELLESLYNQGNPFPKAVRELLFIAGDYCTVLGMGTGEASPYYTPDITAPITPRVMQEQTREILEEEGHDVGRPFYVIAQVDTDSVTIIFLDENKADPDVYHLRYEPREGNPLYRKILSPLSALINNKVERVKQGINPF